jgi:hypothetical protein
LSAQGPNFHRARTADNGHDEDHGGHTAERAGENTQQESNQATEDRAASEEPTWVPPRPALFRRRNHHTSHLAAPISMDAQVPTCPAAIATEPVQLLAHGPAQ